VVTTDYCDPDTDEPIEAPVIRWEGESDLSADEAIAAARSTKTPRSANARDFLQDILAGGKVPQSTIVERGATKGFSRISAGKSLDCGNAIAERGAAQNTDD
jgi:hypothetical protein